MAGGPARLGEALDSVNEALALTDPGHTDRLTLLTNRALLHLRSYEHGGDRERLDAAMADADAAITDGRLAPNEAASASWSRARSRASITSSRETNACLARL